MAISERQVQFAFLENPAVLEAVVGFPPTLIAAYLDIRAWGFAGEIDFVLADPAQQKYITELELVVNSQAKVEHVVEQVVRYHEAARAIYTPGYKMLIILATESSAHWRERITSRLTEAGVAFELRAYDLAHLEQVYLETLERNEAIFGLPHEEIRHSAIASLAQLNEIFAHFKQANKDEFDKEELFQQVTWRTPGTYQARLQYARYLRLLTLEPDDQVRLTASGRKFRDYTNIPYRESGGRYYDLSEPQKRLLRQNILIELRTSEQINRLVMQIVTFLQYLTLIRGKFIPRDLKQELPEGAILIFRELVQKQEALTVSSIQYMIYWNSLYCRNLGLIEVIDDGPFNRSLFTEEGTQFYRLVSDLINIRREESKIGIF